MRRISPRNESPAQRAPVPDTARLLPTPTLDGERSNLLDRISEQGGFAYVSVSALAARGDFRAAEAALEMAWEQLHLGPWHAVLPVWRDAYSMACLYVAACHHGAGESREALRVLDMGILMGGPLLRKDLDSVIEKILLCSPEAGDFGGHNGGSSLAGDVPMGFYEAEAEAEVRRVLPNKSLSSKVVEKRSSLSLERFLRDYFLTGFPVILTDCISHWPARTKWKDIDYLKSVAGNRTVPVEVGRNYLSSEWKQELITFSQFLERVQSSEFCSATTTYLAQHPLFDQIQDLRKDILVPDYCFAGGEERLSLNAWFGPAGTVTPLHHDPHHNLFAQVVGRKYIRLYSASISEELYPYSESMLSNSSQVDLDNPDVNKFPMAQDLDFMDCILEEGEMLYIPPKMWHYVRSLTTSFSVSFWWEY